LLGDHRILDGIKGGEAMFPDSIPHFSIGPLIAFSGNAVISVLCFIAYVIYRHYRPLQKLFLFSLSVTFCFLGWFIYALQRSPESISLGYRIMLATLALMPALWYWFYSALLNERRSFLIYSITFISLLLSGLALFGHSSLLFGDTFEPDAMAVNIMKPESKLLRPLILLYCLGACGFFFFLMIGRLWRSRDQRSYYLIPAAIGLLLWLLGGINDTVRIWGVVFITRAQILWFCSFWLSTFLTFAVGLHFRSLEREMAKLQRAHIDTLEKSRKEFEQLSIAKSKALDHLSHELRTPLAVIQGHIRFLKRKAQAQTSPIIREGAFDIMERNLTRISNIQHETDQIIRSYQELEVTPPIEKIDAREGLAMETISLYLFTERILSKVKQNAGHRDLRIQLDGTNDLSLKMDSGVLEDILTGLLKNSIENTPDEGLVRVVLEQKGQWIQLKVQDFGVGITKENQRHLFGGLFHTLDTELYSSKQPYDFGAGGKGLDLLKMKVYSKRFGFDISVGSQRCSHLAKEGDLCPGKISLCKHCKKPEDCLSSGGSTFCLSFQSLSLF
jgi:signal transduction histidine kinase